MYSIHGKDAFGSVVLTPFSFTSTFENDVGSSGSMTSKLKSIVSEGSIFATLDRL